MLRIEAIGPEFDLKSQLSQASNMSKNKSTKDVFAAIIANRKNAKTNPLIARIC